ncbi:MAG: hypothetical protein KGZ85_08180 [Ignavibacterium sp.]|nr:hypothetical protein [Ignavibacterium sp.]
MKTIGVIGTAKNTGKTTTLSFLLKGFHSKGLNLAVTGIGYDGEEIDNITNLPKPRLYFEKDTILATSEKCLNNTDALFNIIAETSQTTALGKILLIKVTQPGMIVIAGPNSVKGLREIINLINEKTNSDIVLVDGSINRLSPMFILDKLIFTTGASRSINIDQLVNEMAVIEKVFSFKKCIENFNNEDDNIKIVYPDIKLNLYTNTLVDEDDFLTLESSFNQNVEKIIVPGIISVELLSGNFNRLVKRINKPFKIIFNSPFQMLLTDEFMNISALLDLFNKHSVDISYKYKPKLSAVTINPFYPELENYKYISSYLDKEKFLNEMTSSLKIPVFNVLEPDSEKIFELLN